MAEYLILIYAQEAGWDELPEDVKATAHQAFSDFNERNAGVIRGGNQLAPTTTATTVRPQAGADFLVTDGAFAETKEALGGYYLIDVPTLDDAIAIAKEIPMPVGGFEVRPILEFIP